MIKDDIIISVFCHEKVTKRRMHCIKISIINLVVMKLPDKKILFGNDLVSKCSYIKKFFRQNFRFNSHFDTFISSF